MQIRSEVFAQSCQRTNKQTDKRRGKHNLLVGSNKGILETVMFNLLQVQRAGPLAFAKFQLDCCRDVGLGSLKL